MLSHPEVDEDVEDIVLITLQSCTVFWIADLGMTQERVDQLRNSDREADTFLGPIKAWCDENIEDGHYSIYDKGVWFLRGNDAVFFKLRWHQG